MPDARMTGPCGHPTRNAAARDGICRNPAGFRTDHFGPGYCFLHGGAAENTSNLTHGRYSKILKTDIGKAIAQHDLDPDPLNMLPELAAARAVFEEFIARYEEVSAQLEAWFESYTGYKLTPQRIVALDYILKDYESLSNPNERSDLTNGMFHLCREFVDKLLPMIDKPPRPHTILDISDAMRHLEAITKIVERIERVKAQNAISQKDFFRVMGEMGRVVNTVIQDEVLKQRIHREWLSIKIAR
jgi:hypothetical protein